MDGELTENGTDDVEVENVVLGSFLRESVDGLELC
jgi:hypothetical protein